jgi:hypothetical protein
MAPNSWTSTPGGSDLRTVIISQGNGPWGGLQVPIAQRDNNNFYVGLQVRVCQL